MPQKNYELWGAAFGRCSWAEPCWAQNYLDIPSLKSKEQIPAFHSFCCTHDLPVITEYCFSLLQNTEYSLLFAL
jgi:hypothetical protein